MAKPVFLKPSEGDQRGYDRGVNKQKVGVGESSEVALSGAGENRERLTVGPNDASVAEVTETASARPDQRRFSVKGTKLGNAMLEARDSKGGVWAYMQIEVAKAGPIIAPVVNATASNSGRHKTSVDSTLKTLPFPRAYTDPLVPDARLQAALNKSIVAGAPVCFAVVALNPDGTRPMAHFKGNEVHYGASLIKVAAMYSAFELRRTVRDVADELGSGTSRSTLLKQASAYLDPLIMAKVATISKLGGVAQGHALPRYASTFNVVPQSGVPGFLVDFTSGFLNHLNLMISISDNDSAGACVHGSGYGYLNGTLASAGFLDPGTNNGIWLAGDYKEKGAKDKYPAFRIPCMNDTTTAQGATALQLARLFTLMNDGTLVGALSSGEMLDLLTTSVAAGEVYSTRGQRVNFTAVHAKLGRGQLNNAGSDNGKDVLSEAAILEHSSGRRFAVAWLNLIWGSSWEPVSLTLSRTFDEYLKP